LCEAIANQRGEGILQAASAGSEPVASVHPLTLLYLEERGYNITGLKSQYWNDLQAFEPDRIVTVCDSAAGEVCPIWMGTLEKWHWGLPDPSQIKSDDNAVRDAFMSVIDRIEVKVDEWALAGQSATQQRWSGDTVDN
jgi:arsenate reductase (thioredoxin)